MVGLRARDVNRVKTRVTTRVETRVETRMKTRVKTRASVTIGARFSRRGTCWLSQASADPNPNLTLTLTLTGLSCFRLCLDFLQYTGREWVVSESQGCVKRGAREW